MVHDNISGFNSLSSPKLAKELKWFTVRDVIYNEFQDYKRATLYSELIFSFRCHQGRNICRASETEKDAFVERRRVIRGRVWGRHLSQICLVSASVVKATCQIIAS